MAYTVQTSANGGWYLARSVTSYEASEKVLYNHNSVLNCYLAVRKWQEAGFILNAYTFYKDYLGIQTTCQ